MAEDNNDSYQSYNSMVTLASQGLSSLEEICTALQMDEHVLQLQTLEKRMQNQIFSVGVMGEFRRGKSTVINALLGEEIVPSDIVPTSATLNYIRWDVSPRAEINFKDGTTKEVAVEELSQYVTKTTRENEQMAATVEDARVFYPCRFCRNGVQIIDTPGLNDDERMTKITEEIIPQLDAVVLVMSAEFTLSESEARFIREKLLLGDLGRVLFVVNKIDLVSREDRARVMDTTRERIAENILPKLAMVYGEDSDEYRNAQEKMGDIRIYGISAIDALEGRLDGNEKQVRKSGITEFEEALSKLLTQERGLLQLAAPVNTQLAISKEAHRTIVMRTQALDIDQQELEAACEEGMKAIEEARNRTKVQKKELAQAAAGMYQELLPDVENAYGSLEQDLYDYIEELEIDSNDFKDEASAAARSQAITEDIASIAQQQLNAACQALLVKMQTRFGEDLVRLERAGKVIFEDVVKVQEELIRGSDSGNRKGIDMGVAAATSMIAGPVFGVGAMISGWKENGLPGALVGGGVGMAAGAATFFGAAAALTAIGLGALPALPFVLLGGLVSSFAGKKAVEKVFGKNRKTEKIKNNLLEYVSETIAAIRRDRPLESWLKQTSDNVYREVAKKTEEEVEATLLGFERNLSQLRLDRQKQSGEIKELIEDMDELENKLNKLDGQLKPLQEKLNTALNSSVA